jgi:hypothetical protein
MKRRSFVGAVLAASQLVKAGDITTTTFGKVGVIASNPEMQAAMAHVRRMYRLGLTYFGSEPPAEAMEYWKNTV